MASDEGAEAPGPPAAGAQGAAPTAPGSPVSPGSPQVPMMVILPGSTPLGRYLKDAWHHRDLIRVFALRDLKLRYRQTALGVIWVVLQPAMSAGVLSFVFGRVARLPTEGVPAFIFTYASMLGWGVFANSLTRATGAMLGNSSLIAKIFFPRLLLPLSTVAAVVLDFVVGLGTLAVLLLADGRLPGVRVLLLPVWIVLALLLAQGVGSYLGALAVRYRDIPMIVPVISQLLLFASPIAYSADAVPAKFRTLYALNPLVSLFEGFRWSVLGTGAPSAGHVAYSAAMALVVFVAGMYVTERLERSFADII